MSAATAQVIELPSAARMRERLLELEQAVSKPAAEPEPSPALELAADNARLTALTYHLAQMVSAVSSTVDGLEEMCTAEKARADTAEAQLAMANASAAESLEELAAGRVRLAHVEDVVAGLRRQLADAQADSERLRSGHVVEQGCLRATVARLQEELISAKARAEAAEAEVAEVRAAFERNKRMARDVGLACAAFAEARAEGFAIAQEIRESLERWSPS